MNRELFDNILDEYLAFDFLPVGGAPTSLKDAVVVARVAQAVSDAEFKIKGHHTNCIWTILLQDLKELSPHLFGWKLGFISSAASKRMPFSSSTIWNIKLPLFICASRQHFQKISVKWVNISLRLASLFVHHIYSFDAELFFSSYLVLSFPCLPFSCFLPNCWSLQGHRPSCKAQSCPPVSWKRSIDETKKMIAGSKLTLHAP